MNSLTEVWVFSIAICSIILVSSFKLAGRLGLFIGFLISLVFIYLLLHKGLKLFLDQIKSELHKGSDPTGFNQLISQNITQYPIHKYFLHYTNERSHPLVYRDFKNDAHFVVNKNMVDLLDAEEKFILVHLLLSHCTEHSKLRRRFFSIIYLSLHPVSQWMSLIFNTMAGFINLKKQIFKADLLALKNSNSLTPEQRNDFSLFLRKIHNLNFHQTKYQRGENYFSILSTSQASSFNLKLSPSLDIRLKNLMGDLTKK